MKIVLITAHFPSYDCPGKSYATPFLYNYAKEWVKIGHEVHVIHLCRKYPFFFNRIANISAKVGYTGLQRYVVHADAQTDKDYNYNGVRIHRRSYLKLIPHGRVGKYSITKLGKTTKDIITKTIGNPDLIIGDCVDPVLKVIKNQGDVISCPKLQILHDSDFKQLQEPALKTILQKMDCILLRSKKQLSLMESAIGKHNYRYMYSGIPDEVLSKDYVPRTNIKKLIYVGALYKSKGLETILKALSTIDFEEFRLEVIGDGVDRHYFEEQTKKYGIERIVNYIGQVPHEDVFGYMRNADALLLISQETFGMVYVEAMSQGCIPIGAKNQGIDGIVINSKNGYLVALEDYVGLASLLNHIKNLPRKQIESISNNAYTTAVNMTESKLANELLEEIIK